MFVDDVVLALELDLQKPDDTVVLELLTDGPHQDWTHFASGTRQYPESVFDENGDFRRRAVNLCNFGQRPSRGSA